MKVKTIILAFIALLVAVDCNHSKTFKVTLNIDNADGQAVYLCKNIDDNTDAVIDSAVISGQKAVLTAPQRRSANALPHQIRQERPMWDLPVLH